MEQSSLTFQTFKNISYNIAGYVWPMIFTLFVTPVIVHGLGVKGYGIYIFVYTVIGLFGILDFGVGISLTRNLAFYTGKKDRESIIKLVFSGNSLFLIIATIGLICAGLIASFSHSYGQYSSLILIAGAIFFVNTIDTTYSAVMYSLQRFDISNGLSIVSITLSSLSTLAIVLAKGSLEEIFLAQLAVSIIITLATFYYGKKILPEAPIKIGWDKGEIKKCLSFSAVVSINNIANSALLYLDRLIIPFFAGPSNLTYYSMPGNVTTRIPSFANVLSTTIFPTTSQLEGGGDSARLEALYVRSFRLITMISAAVTVTAIAFGYKVLLFWLSADFAARSTNILIILAFTNFLLALLGPLSNFLFGLGKLKFIAIMSTFMAVLNATLLIILLPRYGITGAAWAYLISVLPVLYMFYYTEKNYLTLTGRKKYYAKKLLATLISSALVWLIDIYLISPFVTNLTKLLCAGIISLVIYIIIYKLFGFLEEEDWRDAKNFFIAVMQRLKIKSIKSCQK